MDSNLGEILGAGLAAADPEAAVSSILDAREAARGGLSDRIFLLSVGKAAGAMSRAALGALGDRGV